MQHAHKRAGAPAALFIVFSFSLLRIFVDGMAVERCNATYVYATSTVHWCVIFRHNDTANHSYHAYNPLGGSKAKATINTMEYCVVVDAVHTIACCNLHNAA